MGEPRGEMAVDHTSSSSQQNGIVESSAMICHLISIVCHIHAQFASALDCQHHRHIVASECFGRALRCQHIASNRFAFNNLQVVCFRFQSTFLLKTFYPHMTMLIYAYWQLIDMPVYATYSDQQGLSKKHLR